MSHFFLSRAGKFLTTQTLKARTLASEHFPDPHQKSKERHHAEITPTFARQSRALRSRLRNDVQKLTLRSLCALIRDLRDRSGQSSPSRASPRKRHMIRRRVDFCCCLMNPCEVEVCGGAAGRPAPAVVAAITAFTAWAYAWNCRNNIQDQGKHHDDV